MDLGQDKYKLDVVDNLLALMKQEFGDVFKSFYDGDPIVIPIASLPAIIVEKPVGQVNQDATSTDKLGSELRLKLVLNKADDYGATDAIALTEKKLRRYVEGIDPDTNTYARGTVMYILRTNINLGGSVLDWQIDINYDLQPRPRQLVTSEAQISLVTQERLIRPNQSSVN